jgi:serralysin
MAIFIGQPTRIAPGEISPAISGDSAAVVAMGAGATVLSVAGAIRTGENTGIFIGGALSSQQVVIEATGSVVMNGSGLNPIGISTAGAGSPQVKNFGRIEVVTGGLGTGISVVGATTGHLNFGTITVTGSGYGVNLQGTTEMDFLNSGSITAVGVTTRGVILTGATVSFINTASGVIQALGSASSVGLFVGANSTLVGTGVRNYGLIEGVTSLQLTGFASNNNPTIEVLNGAGGILRGKVLGSSGSDRLTNTGLVEGEVIFGAGNDLYEGAGGRATGMVQGGEGDDSLRGGEVFDYLHGNQGDDSIAGGAFGDWVVGGQGNDIIQGDAGDDIVQGNLGNDTCFGGDGPDIVRGGQGNDSVSGGGGNDFVSGDRGDDTLSGGGGADRFHSFAEAGIDQVVDFNRAEGDVVNLIAGSTYTVAQVGLDVVIAVGDSAQMVLVGVSLASLTGDWLTVG